MRRTVLVGVLAVVASLSVLAAQQPPVSPQAKPAETAPPQGKTAEAPARPAVPAVNVRIEMTIADQRENANASPKSVSVVVANGESGRIRTGSGSLMLNVDARPDLLRDGRVRLFFSLEYRPASGEGERAMALTESLTTILEDGRPLTVSQSADPATERSVKVDLKATILK